MLRLGISRLGMTRRLDDLPPALRLTIFAAARTGLGHIAGRVERLSVVACVGPMRSVTAEGTLVQIFSRVQRLAVVGGRDCGRSQPLRPVRPDRRSGLGRSRAGFSILLGGGPFATTPAGRRGCCRTGRGRGRCRPALTEVAEPLVVLVVVHTVTAGRAWSPALIAVGSPPVLTPSRCPFTDGRGCLFTAPRRVRLADARPIMPVSPSRLRRALPPSGPFRALPPSGLRRPCWFGFGPVAVARRPWSALVVLGAPRSDVLLPRSPWVRRLLTAALLTAARSGILVRPAILGHPRSATAGIWPSRLVVVLWPTGAHETRFP